MRTMMLGLLMAVAAGARAGVVLTMETVNGKATTKTVAEVDADRFRVDAGDQKTVVIYRKDQDAFWMLTPSTKSWTEMTRADIQAMSAKMDGMMKEMQAQMKDMPPAQRAQMEAMMKGHMPGAAAAPTYKKIADGVKAGKWTATQYAVLRDGKKTADVFHADPKAVGLAEADFAVFVSLADLFKSLTHGLESAGFYLPGKPGGDQPAGVLVRSVKVGADGKPGAVSTLTDVRRTAFAASEFEIPAGWTKRESPMARMDHPGAGGGH